MNTIFPLYLFDATSTRLDKKEKSSNESLQNDKGGKLFCRICNALITYNNQRIEVDSSHSHLRTNPGGHEYHIECFKSAQGCAAFGTATDEFTWFRGYKWQIVVCRGCGEHLGWYFRAGNSFYGLIASRLIQDPDQS